MIGAFGATDVFHCDVRDDLVHGIEQLVARLLRTGLIGVDPHAGQLLFDGGTHVAEEGSRSGVSVRRGLGGRLGRLVSVMRRVVVSHGRHGGHRVGDGRVELVGRRRGRRHSRDAVELLARIHFHRQTHLLVVHGRLLVVVHVVVVVVVCRY